MDSINSNQRYPFFDKLDNAKQILYGLNMLSFFLNLFVGKIMFWSMQSFIFQFSLKESNLLLFFSMHVSIFT